jgi:hypothetical protein
MMTIEAGDLAVMVPNLQQRPGDDERGALLPGFSQFLQKIFGSLEKEGSVLAVQPADS